MKTIIKRVKILLKSVQILTLIFLFSKDNVLVSIEAELGDFDDEDCPFKLEVSLNGYFKYTVDKDDSKDVEQLKQLVTQNALAILYPYLRNVVSDVTLKSNRFPAYILPVMNIAELMKQNDSIKIYDIGDLKAKIRISLLLNFEK
ncbi:protein-export chaperone SecB [Enterococcus faecalis]|uniref:protein-export chaperone SecB n=1 Tax=Enterococcus faecalis TaxID=1351 RepID=UPI001F5B46F9|nr:protein-export chaperone SecB [Enterococcus faecalis]UNQ06683.1 protein-export chaperone SecB [Enterococcus faecalis]